VAFSTDWIDPGVVAGGAVKKVVDPSRREQLGSGVRRTGRANAQGDEPDLAYAQRRPKVVVYLAGCVVVVVFGAVDSRPSFLPAGESLSLCPSPPSTAAWPQSSTWAKAVTEVVPLTVTGIGNKSRLPVRLSPSGSS